MQGTVSPTDFGWYEFLFQQRPAEANFWKPSARRGLRADPFSPFFFKLKAPHNAICGFGFFTRYTHLPDWLAWECFGAGNGVPSLEALRERLATIRERIRYRESAGTGDIGCVLIASPVFFPRDAWIPQPVDWPPRSLTPVHYDLTRGEGQRIWQACQERAIEFAPAVIAEPESAVVSETGPRYGAPREIRPRLGQGTFRVLVTDAYGRACAVTQEHSLPALEAAHIRSYARDGPHDVRNGLLFRADLHRLFDLGYVTVTLDRRLEVGRRLRDDYSNGRSYYPLHGKELRLPAKSAERPAPEFIRWHNEHVYRG